MKAVHRLLGVYSTIVVFFVLLFLLVIVSARPTPLEVFSMTLSIIMFALIPFGIIFLLRRHHRR